MTKYILIAEDDDTYRQRYVRNLRGKFKVLEAVTVEEARQLFRQHHRHIAGVIMDGRLGGNELNTLDLIKEIRGAGWAGKMVAASTSGHYRKKMLEAGCNAESAKYELSKALPGIFE